MPQRGEFPAGNLRRRRGQQTRLDFIRDLKFAFDASFFDRDLVQPRVVDRDGSLVRERAEEFEIVLGKDARLEPVIDVDNADDGTFGLQGYAEDRAEAEVGDAGAPAEPAIALRVARQLWRTFARDALDQSARNFELGRVNCLTVQPARAARKASSPSAL